MTRLQLDKRSAVLITLVTALLLALLPASAGAGGGEPAQRVVVTFDPGSHPGAQDKLSDEAGTIKRRIDDRSLAVEVSGSGLRTLRRDRRVAAVEVDHELRAVAVPNDMHYGKQWALADIMAPAAWDVVTGSPEIKVAVLDTGVNEDHPDLQGPNPNEKRVVINKSYATGSLTSNDLNGHGTMVAGLIGATGNNAKGITGVGWRISLMNYKVLRDDGQGFDSDMARGIQEAIRDGAHVINISADGRGVTTAMINAVADANSANILVVAAAGNDGASEAKYPAALEGVVAVGATDANKNRAGFSNYGSWVDIAAPGDQVLTTYARQCLVLSTKPAEECYAPGRGTSFSSPLVAGVAALVRQRFGPISASLLRCRILNSAAPMPGQQLGAGRVQAHTAVAGLNEVPGYLLDGWGGLHAVGGAPAPSSTAYWPGWDIARDIGTGGGRPGWVLDGWGGLHPFNGAAGFGSTGYWPGWDIARAVAVRAGGGGGWVLDGWGGLHRFGNAPGAVSSGYWRGWDIARDVALDPTDPNQTRGWVLDGWGGLHPFGGAPAVRVTGYWPQWDIARKIVVNPNGQGGWVLDGWGGLHAFGTAALPPAPANPSYPARPARDATVRSDGTGQVVTGYGHVALVPNRGCSEAVRWPGWDIARAFAPTG